MATNPTGISQETLNAVLRAGQYNNLDSNRFNSSNIDRIAQQNAIDTNITSQLSPININAQNAPNSTVQNRELTNAFLGVNKQAFDLQNMQIGNQANLQQQQLARNAKDAMNQNLLMYGSSGATDSRDSSRNLSNLTSTEAGLSQALGNIRMKQLELTGQNTLNFSQQNAAILQSNRQNDVQDRQLNLQEGFQRGQETGEQFQLNPVTGKVESTGKLNLAGKAMEAEMTGNYTDFMGNKTRSLTGLQVDAALRTSQVENAIGFARLTGFTPDFSTMNMETGGYNPAFDFTRNTGQLTQDARLNAGALAQSGYNSNLYNAMTRQGLYNEQVEAERSNINTAISNNMAQQEINKATTDYYKQSFGEQGAQTLSNSDAARQALANATTPEAKAQALQQIESYDKALQSQYGEGAGLYYNITKNTKLNKDGTPGSVETLYTADANALAKYGINFDVDFNKNNPEEEKVQKKLEGQLQEAMNANTDISRVINKMVVAGGNPNETFLALARRNGTSIGNGYDFLQINTSQMTPNDKIEFMAAVTKTNEANPKALDELAVNVIKKFETNNKLQVNRGISAPDFISAMRFKGADRGNFLNMKGTTNEQIARLGFLGNTPAMKSLIKADPSLQTFDNNMLSLRGAIEGIQSSSSVISDSEADNIIRQIKSNLTKGGTYRIGGNGPTINLPKIDAPVKDAISEYMLQNNSDINYAKNMLAASLPLQGSTDTNLGRSQFKIGNRAFDLASLFQ